MLCLKNGSHSSYVFINVTFHILHFVAIKCMNELSFLQHSHYQICPDRAYGFVYLTSFRLPEFLDFIRNGSNTIVGNIKFLKMGQKK